MATLTGQTIASSYEQLLSLPDGGGDGANLVAITDGDGVTTFCISMTDASTGKAILAVDGSHANGTEIQIDNSATDGDAFLSFQLSGTSKFTMGVDDGDSDKFKIGTTAIGTGTMLTLDANGAVTMPVQPAFLVNPASMQSNIAIDTNVTIVFGTERFDQGSDFASNTFTAPVTGKYSLNYNLYVLNIDSAADYYSVELVTSNRTYTTIIDPDFGQDATYWSLTNTVLADMDASDTAFLRIYQGGGTAQTDIGTVSHFSGHLAC